MNLTFSLKRFGLLFKKHTVENYKGYLMSLFVLTGILSATLFLIIYQSGMPLMLNVQTNIFAFFFLLSGTIFTSNVFINLSDKRKTIATLTLPASTVEKFLIGWLYSLVIFQILFTAIFYAILLVSLNLGKWTHSSIHLMNVFSTAGDQRAYLIYIAYPFIHSIMIFGAIFFNKMHFIKTAFAFFIIGLVIWLLNDELLKLMIHHDIFGNSPFGGLSFKDHHNYENVDVSADNHKWIITLFLALPVIVWLSAYFRLREKQV